MTDEEKDILQDKALFEEANENELEQHKLLMNSDSNYKTEFVLKEGVARASAKGFLEKALETPVISIWSRRSTWQAIAAVLVVVFASTFFLSDFRTANEFAQAELQELPSSSTELFGKEANVSRSGEVNWRRLFDEGEYELIINGLNWLSVGALDSLETNLSEIRRILEMRLDQYQAHVYSHANTSGQGLTETLLANEIDSLRIELSKLENEIDGAYQGEEELSTLRFALALSKLKSNASEASQDFGQYEFEWMLGDSSNYPTGVAKVDLIWYSSLSEYKAGDCEKTHSVISELVKYSDSQYFRRAKKFKRKLERECDLD